MSAMMQVQYRLGLDVLLATIANLEPNGWMPRITIAVNDEDHRALKLLGLLENKNLGTVLIEAVRAHLQQKGAYDLDVTSTKP
jgi:hypothetical protein